ncbi:MAG: glutamate racemase [Acidimicrobiales bacterium]
MTDDRPIGIFDSGFGGLTVARAVIDVLPREHIVYFGDTGRYPYGPRPIAQVREFAHQVTRVLVAEHNVKAVVVACNTAAAAALGELERASGVPIIGVIRPGAESLVDVTENGRVGVIGTVGTIASGAYQETIEAMAGGLIQLTCAACPGLVEFVERGEFTGDQVTVLAERLLAPVREAKVDSLLLACTHYPYLARTIGSVMGDEVVLVSSADETAFVVLERLTAMGLTRSSAGGAPQRRFISSGDVTWFADLGRRLLGPELSGAEAHNWSSSLWSS